MPLALLLMIGGATLIYTGFRGDPSGGFNPLKWIGSAFGNQLSTVKDAPTRAASIQGASVAVGDTTGLENVARNRRVGNRIRKELQRKFPTARYAGTCNCRHRRGGGADTTQWSVHSVCGASDWFGPVEEIKQWANTEGKAFGVTEAYIDNPPGNVHVQWVPNPPEGWVPPCAR